MTAAEVANPAYLATCSDCGAGLRGRECHPRCREVASVREAGVARSLTYGSLKKCVQCGGPRPVPRGKALVGYYCGEECYHAHDTWLALSRRYTLVVKLGQGHWAANVNGTLVGVEVLAEVMSLDPIYLLVAIVEGRTVQRGRGGDSPWEVRAHVRGENTGSWYEDGIVGVVGAYHIRADYHGGRML